MMIKIAAALAIVTLSVIAGCKTQPANLLIGKWKLVSGATGCSTAMTYTDKQLTQTDYQGQTSTMDVSYVAANQDQMPTSVFVMTNAGVTNHTTWNFSDKDTVQLDAYTMCTYKRQ